VLKLIKTKSNLTFSSSVTVTAFQVLNKHVAGRYVMDTKQTSVRPATPSGASKASWELE
jgi:hypothetical protein